MCSATLLIYYFFFLKALDVLYRLASNSKKRIKLKIKIYFNMRWKKAFLRKKHLLEWEFIIVSAAVASGWNNCRDHAGERSCSAFEYKLGSFYIVFYVYTALRHRG